MSMCYIYIYIYNLILHKPSIIDYVDMTERGLLPFPEETIYPVLPHKVEVSKCDWAIKQ